MRAISDTQRRVLEFIRAQHVATGVFPTVREIMGHMGFRSTNTVDYHVRRLEEAGELTRVGRQARHFQMRPPARPRRAPVVSVPPTGELSRGIPMLGRVAAGEPILATQNFDGLVNFERFFHCDDQTFALRVQGDSMVDAGIMDGDTVVVRAQGKVDNGEIGVAVIDDAATVKRIFEEPTRWRLQPENPSLRPVYVSKTDPGFRVAGKVIGVIRKI